MKSTMTREKPFRWKDSGAGHAIPSRSASWLSELRHTARECYEALEFPTTKNEEWRFTNLIPFLSVPYDVSISQPGGKISLEELNRRLPGVSQASRIVFINGLYSPDLSSGISDGNVIVSTLSGVLGNEADLQDHFGRYASYDSNIFTALNTASFHDGICVLIRNGVTVDRPVHLIFVGDRFVDGAQFPRVLVRVGEGSSVSIVESYLGMDQERYWTGAVTEVALEPAADLEHCRIECDSGAAAHVGITEVYMRRDSSYRSFSLSLGAALSRNDLNVVLDDPGADASLYGLYLVSGSQLVDHHTTMDHVKSHGTSRELYKGILAGHSRAVFNGRIIVRKGAQKTDAVQTNKNLLIADGARVHTKPQLEIFADDVKCKHGATIGHLEEDALFYLRSRGIGEARARTLLMHGFVFDVLEEIRKEDTRILLEGILRARLQEFAGFGEAS